MKRKKGRERERRLRRRRERTGRKLNPEHKAGISVGKVHSV